MVVEDREEFVITLALPGPLPEERGKQNPSRAVGDSEPAVKTFNRAERTSLSPWGEAGDEGGSEKNSRSNRPSTIRFHASPIYVFAARETAAARDLQRGLIGTRGSRWMEFPWRCPRLVCRRAFGPSGVRSILNFPIRNSQSQDPRCKTPDLASGPAPYCPLLLSGTHHSRPGLLKFCSRWKSSNRMK